MEIVKHQGLNILILILSGITVAFIVFPLASILTFAEPTKLFDSLTRPELWDALVLSLISATISTLFLALFGIPLAYFLARYTNFRGKFIIRVAVIIPLVLPPLASGALLLGVFGPNSSLTQYFPRVEFTQSMLGIIIAQTYVASPFMILASQAAFESVDKSYEMVARSLGKSKLETFFRISLPLAKTGIIIGVIMSWVRAAGELGATMMMAYNPHTISIQIFEDNAIGGLRQAVSGIILVVLLAILIIIVLYIINNKGLRVISLGKSNSNGHNYYLRE
jgi:molybdate/tungstate transport system permease protein